MAVTVADIQKRFSEFAGVTTDRIQDAIDQAERCTNRGQWGGKADDAVSYMAAHIIKLLEAGDGFAAGPASACSVGGVSQSFAVSKFAQDSVLGSTAYGRHLIGLRCLVVPARCF